MEGDCRALKLPLRKGGFTSSLFPPISCVGLPEPSASSCWCSCCLSPRTDLESFQFRRERSPWGITEPTPLRRAGSLCQLSREFIYPAPLGFTGQVWLCFRVLLPLRWNPKSKAKVSDCCCWWWWWWGCSCTAHPLRRENCQNFWAESAVSAFLVQSCGFCQPLTFRLKHFLIMSLFYQRCKQEIRVCVGKEWSCPCQLWEVSLVY